ncbi:MAG: nitroreductase [Candidatus Muproteobacteria bacterium RBG_16_64_11]|uniref:Nitroreductase n=1 Tax=Candidatus Muproteobacteria bacterium RBG_16_64_11 TaxID=1817758 RepID=A0A1F6TDB7_9PROT|nr:MAG: nitroreductase [Candidatus Muproteobacteria bacterium RBG_16_64_11]
MARDVRTPERKAVALPAPHRDGATALERAFAERRSVREFARGALTLPQVAQLLWAAQGVTQRDGARTAPSAGALYPLELYLVAGEVRELAPGIYRYVPGKHQLEPVAAGDERRGLCAAALAQECVAAGAAVFVFTAVERRTTRKYGPRGVRYVHIEVGHAAQNLALQATALGLGSVTVGAFDDAAVARLLQLPAGEAPLYLMPVGLR